MITQSDIGEGDRLGAQMNSFAVLKWLSLTTGHEIVFHGETVHASQGIQLLDVFDLPVKILPPKRPSLSSLMFRAAAPLMKSFWAEGGFAVRLLRKAAFVVTRLAYMALRFEWRREFSVYRAPWGPRLLCDPELLRLLKDTSVNVDIPSGRLGAYAEWRDRQSEVLACFNFKNALLIVANILMQAYRMAYPERKLVAVHCRMTDYLKVSSLNLSEAYYRKALDFYAEDRPVFVVFSDDPCACHNRPEFQRPDIVFFEGPPYVSLCLMTFFDSFIVSNSSFSFWGAMLSPAANKRVVCPVNIAGSGSPLNGHWYPQDWMALPVT